MNFSSSLMSGMGISLGGLEIATDFLFANPEFYEPELTEIKSTISNKPKESIQKNVKTVKPKVNRETIINKFSIIKTKPVLVSDEIIENSNLVKEVDDFDFSFDIVIDSLSKDSVVDDSDAEALNIMKRMNTEVDAEDVNLGVDDYNNDIDLNFDSEEDTDDTINIDNLDLEEDTGDDEEFNIDSLDIEEDTDTEDEDNDMFDIDSLDFEEDDTELEEDDVDLLNLDSEQDNEEDDVFSIDSLDLEEDTDSDNTLEINDELMENEIDSLDLDEDPEIDSLDLEDRTNSNGIKDQLNNSIDEIDLDDIMDIGNEESLTIKPSVSKTVSNENTADTKYDAEIIALKNKIAAMEKEMHNRTSDKAIKDTSELKKKDNNFIKDDSLDTLIKGNKPSSKVVQSNSYDKYTVLNTEQLYNYVREFMLNNGLRKSTIDIAVLNQKFGEANIKKLIQKSYLIKIGKGVTTGR